jgi:hypothetical protein
MYIYIHIRSTAFDDVAQRAALDRCGRDVGRKAHDFEEFRHCAAQPWCVQVHAKVMQQLQQDRNHFIDELMAYLQSQEQFQNEYSIEQVSRTRCRHLVGRGDRRDAFRRRRIRRYSVCAYRTSVQSAATLNGWNLRKLG